MRMFDAATSYKTEKNAMRKLSNVLGDRLPRYHWMIAVNSTGRFVPVVQHRDPLDVALIHRGICVVG